MLVWFGRLDFLVDEIGGGGSPWRMPGPSWPPLLPDSLELVDTVDGDELLGDEPRLRKVLLSSLIRSLSLPLLPVGGPLPDDGGGGCISGLVLEL